VGGVFCGDCAADLDEFGLFPEERGCLEMDIQQEKERSA
jgi:hypothetical protein